MAEARDARNLDHVPFHTPFPLFRQGKVSMNAHVSRKFQLLSPPRSCPLVCLCHRLSNELWLHSHPCCCFSCRHGGHPDARVSIAQVLIAACLGAGPTLPTSTLRKLAACSVKQTGLIGRLACTLACRKAWLRVELKQNRSWEGETHTVHFVQGCNLQLPHFLPL